MEEAAVEVEVVQEEEVEEVEEAYVEESCLKKEWEKACGGENDTTFKNLRRIEK